MADDRGPPAPTGRVLLERDESCGIARLPLDNPARRNAYDPTMRDQLAAHLDELAADDAIKVVILRGSGDVFSTGADMGNAYAWYGKDAKTQPGTNADDDARRARRPSHARTHAPNRPPTRHDRSLGLPSATGQATAVPAQVRIVSAMVLVCVQAKVGPSR
jgi:hypothetical protein